jgi:O-antigen/teichoic acid export membrane protein
MDVANYVFLAARVLQIIINIVLLKDGYGLWALYFGFFLYYAFPFVIWIFILFKDHHIRVFNISTFNKNKLSELIRFGGAFSTGVIASMFVMPFNRIIIARYVGLEDVTYYEIAIRVIMSIRDLFVKGLEALLPKISYIHGSVKESIEPILAVHKKGMKLVFCVALPVFLFMFLFSDPILKLWLGSRFNENISVLLRFLTIGWAVNATAVPDYFMFMGINKLKYSVSDEWIRSLVNVFLVVILISINFKMTVSTIGMINAISLICGSLFLKYKYFQYRASLLPATYKE